MRSRVHTPSMLPIRNLRVRREVVDGAVRYIGVVRGRTCVSSGTREGAVQALLRRVAQESIF